MLKFKHCLFVILGLFSQTGICSDRAERLFWDKYPLKITLPVGKERLVTFPHGVRVGIPAALASRLRTQINQGTVYWLAKEPFKSQRIEVREITGKQIYLIDLAATKQPGQLSTPIEILLKQDEPSATVTQKRPRRYKRKPGYIALTRFAAQQLYAPKRLLKSLPGIHRVSISRTPTIYLLRGNSVRATPLASWKSGHLYITAVELINTGSEIIDLDPRNLRGEWRAATFQHNRLYPGGSDADTTAVYLISDRPFQEVI